VLFFVLCLFKLFHRKIIRREQDDVRAEPGEGFGPEYAGIADESGQNEGGKGSHDELRKAAQHGNERVAHTLKSRAIDVEEIQNRQRAAHDVEKFAADADGLLNFLGIFARDKGGDKVLSENEHAGGDDERGDYAQNRRNMNAFSDALMLARAEILSGVSAGGIAEGYGGDFKNAVKLA